MSFSDVLGSSETIAALAEMRPHVTGRGMGIAIQDSGVNMFVLFS